MTTLQTSSRRPAPRTARGVGMIVGALLFALPFASAQAAQSETHLDLRQALATQQHRLTLELVAFLGRSVERSTYRFAEYRGALARVTTFDMDFDWKTSEEAAPAASPRFDYVSDTEDPLAGM